MPDGKPGDRPRGELTPEERAALEKRSSELGRKLEEARQKEHGGKPSTSDGGRREAMGRAIRLSAELIGGVVVGSAIGVMLDRWMETKGPYFFILFFLLGSAAGMMNVIRVAMKDQKRPRPPEKGDGDGNNRDAKPG